MDTTTTEHVTAASWRQIQKGERFPEERALAAHLRSGCETCETTLASFDRSDGLDGPADAALLGIAPQKTARDDLAFERVMRKLNLDSRVKGDHSLPPRRLSDKAMPLGLAACLAFGGVTVLALKRIPPASKGYYQGEKGEQTAPEVFVSFAVAPPSGDALEHGVPDAKYAEDKAVMLRYDLSAPSFVTLIRISPEGKGEILAQPGRLGAGRHDLSVNNMPAGVSLKGFVGRNRFAVLGSFEPLSHAEILQVIGVLTSDEEVNVHEKPLSKLGMAHFDIEVIPAEP